MGESASNPTAMIGLGSNLGDRIAALRRALAELSAIDGISIQQVASLYESSPVGGPPNQPDYLNTVAQIATSLSPIDLLHQMQTIETSMGRQRAEHWGPRLIDLDLLCYADQVINTSEPRASARADMSSDRCDGTPKDEEARSSSSPTNKIALTLPHPRMHQRLFVLEPLSEIAPDWVHPVLKMNATALLVQCRQDHPDQQISRIPGSNWYDPTMCDARVRVPHSSPPAKGETMKQEVEPVHDALHTW